MHKAVGKENVKVLGLTQKRMEFVAVEKRASQSGKLSFLASKSYQG